MTQYYGTIKIDSDKIRVTDPCYSKSDIDCAYIIDSVAQGLWEVTADITDAKDGWGARVHSLTIAREGYTSVLLNDIRIRHAVSVDSGQAGFFIEDLYPDGERSTDSDIITEGDLFYEIACNLTLSKEMGGVIIGKSGDIGAVSCTGYGDGIYDLVLYKDNKGKVCAATVIFIDDQEED